MKGKNDKKLFDDNDELNWKNEWMGMPEFIQEKQSPFSQIIVRFRNEQDLEDFSKIIGQKLTPLTKSIWHPFLIRGVNSKKRYRNEP